MKKTVFIHLLCLICCLNAISCDKIRTGYQEEEDCTARFYDEMYESFAHDAIWAASYAYIFNEYQKIRTDRTASLEYVGQYDYIRSLNYDYWDTGDMKISIKEDGDYLFEGDRRFGNYLYDISKTLNIHFNENGVMEITCHEDENSAIPFQRYSYSLSCKATADGEFTYTSEYECSFIYSGNHHSISSGDSILKRPMKGDEYGRLKCFPVEGTLIYTKGKLTLTAEYSWDSVHLTGSNGYDKISHNFFQIKYRPGEY
ncbi:MAG: hypothetical protein ACI3ZN_03305 [Candidatus Cryptobacteroides sp.]